MGDEIDLGDGVTAEFCDGDFALTDEVLRMGIVLTTAEARKFARFVDEKAGKE